MAKYFVTFIKKSPDSSNISGEEIFYESDKSLYGEEFEELIQELTTHFNVAETEYNLFSYITDGEDTENITGCIVEFDSDMTYRFIIEKYSSRVW